jgi:hypothetical protein
MSEKVFYHSSFDSGFQKISFAVPNKIALPEIN